MGSNDFPDLSGLRIWRHIIVGVVLVLWVADIVGTQYGWSEPNLYLHSFFGLVTSVVFGLEVRGLKRAIERRLEEENEPGTSDG